MFSCVNVDQLNSLEDYFKADVEELICLLQSLPDNERKVEMLKASQISFLIFVCVILCFQAALDDVEVIRGAVTANCHAAIISAVMEDCQT